MSTFEIEPSPDGERARASGSRFPVLRNVLSNWGGFVFAAVVNLFLSPYVVHSLGDTLYGAWVLLASLVGYLGLVDLGVRGAVTKYVATYHAGGRHDEASRLASTAAAIFSGAGLLAIAVSFGVALLLLPRFDIAPELLPEARTVVVLGGVSIAVSILGGVYGGVVTAMQRFDLENAAGIVGTIARAALVVGALRAGGGLLELALIQLGIACFRLLASFVLAGRVYPVLKVRFSLVSRTRLRTIMTFGLTSALIHAFGTLINYSDSVVIGAFLPIGMITFFAIAANLSDYCRQVVSGISYIVTPLTAAIQGEDEEHRIARVLLNSGRFATLVSLPIVMTFIVRGESFIDLWMGPEYGGLAGHVLAVLSLGLWVFPSFQIVTTTMMGMNRHRGMVPAVITEGAANLALSIALLPSMGVIGVAWGTALPRIAMSVVYSPWYARKVLEIPLAQFWLEVLLRPTIAMLPFAAVSYGIEIYWPATGFAVYFAQILLALPVAALGAWAVGLLPDERATYGKLIADRFHRDLSSRSEGDAQGS